jgi:hypothetical protein
MCAGPVGPPKAARVQRVQKVQRVVVSPLRGNAYKDSVTFLLFRPVILSRRRRISVRAVSDTSLIKYRSAGK